MTSPRDAHRLVGHSSPQPEAGSSAAGAAPIGPAAAGSPAASERPWQDEDIVDVLRRHGGSFNEFPQVLLQEAACIIELQRAEAERLRTALRAVRACTDPQWQAQLISDALRETKP